MSVRSDHDCSPAATQIFVIVGVIRIIWRLFGFKKLYGETLSAAGVVGSGVSRSKTSAEVMSTHTGRRHSPQGQHNVYTQAQHGVVVPGRRADGGNRPFPNKPVSHRRSLPPRKQDVFDPYDLEKSAIPKQPRGPLLPQEHHHSHGTRKTTRSRDPRNDPAGRQPRGELQMARAIHAKELILQEKLWNVEEKIRQRIRRDTAALEDQKSEEQRHYRGRAERGEPERRREVRMQEDVKQHARTHYQEERAGARRRKVGDDKATHRIAVPEREVSGELNRPRWEKVREHTRRKERDEQDNGFWGETGVKSQDGTAKARERHQDTASMGDKGRRRETTYGERTRKETSISDEERDEPRTSQRASGRAAAEGRKPTLPPVPQPSHSSRPEPRERRQEVGAADGGLQLLPCKICNRKFASKRLEKHVEICEKVKQSQRGVFNSYLNRTKGSAVEEFWKTHSKSPEVVKKTTQRQNQVNTRNLHEGRLPGGASQPKWSK